MTAPPTVRIIAGHTGSGKTEVAVSLALHLAAAGRRVALADLDVVNSSFRSRERAALMEARSIRIISSSPGHGAAIDLPAISAEVRGPLHDPAVDVILDVGGDNVGARALTTLTQDIVQRGYDLLLVVNAYRPDTNTVDGVVGHLHAIELTTGLRFTGLISNTHAIQATTSQDVLNGCDLTRQVSELTGLPVQYVTATPVVLRDLPADLPGERLPLGLFMRDEWM